MKARILDALISGLKEQREENADWLVIHTPQEAQIDGWFDLDRLAGTIEQALVEELGRTAE